MKNKKKNNFYRGTCMTNKFKVYYHGKSLNIYKMLLNVYIILCSSHHSNGLICMSFYLHCLDLFLFICFFFIFGKSTNGNICFL